MRKVVGITEIVLWADEIEQMVAWYRDLLGLEQISSPERKKPIFLKAGEGHAGVPQMIVVVQKPEEIKALPSGYQLHHLAFELPPEEYEAQKAVFLERRLEVRGRIHPVLAVNTFYVDDPMGNEVQFMCRKEKKPPKSKNWRLQNGDWD
jgi:catechol-2,3-dioxygenase